MARRRRGRRAGRRPYTRREDADPARAAARPGREVGRRRLAAVAVGAALAFVAGIVIGAGGGSGGEVSEPDVPQLPRGGTSLLPEHRLVGFYGAPQDDALGALGIGSPARAGERLAEQARAYRGNRPVLPVFELVVAIAASDPGDDGLYVLRQPHSVIRRYLEEARRRRALLILDVQPGRSGFEDELDRLWHYLREPDVGLALDPEWAVGPDEVPGQVIGSVDADTVNAISAELAELVRERDLPEKLLLVHQFTEGMISDREDLRDRPGVALALNSDGFGDQANKVAKYRELRPRPESPLYSGFKLFFDEDVDMMQPPEVLGLQPKPDVIVYE